MFAGAQLEALQSQVAALPVLPLPILTDASAKHAGQYLSHATQLIEA